MPPITAPSALDRFLDDLDPELARIAADLTRALARSAHHRGGRATHTTGVSATGRLRVTAGPDVPPHPLLRPGAEYAVALRHASFKGMADDAVRDGRSASLRLLAADVRGDDGQPRLEDGLFDLILSTGDTFVLRDAHIFHRWFFASLEQRAEILRWYAAFAPSFAGFVRSPDSFTDLDYHSQITYHFDGEDGARRLARFRLTVPEDRPDGGLVDPAELQLPLDYVPRRAGDARPTTYLRDEFRRRVGDGGVDYRLQVQLRELPADPAARRAACDTTVAWPVAEFPWRELAALHLGEVLPEDVAARLAFNVARTPRGLELVRAEDAADPAAIGHLRAIAYVASAAVRQGRPLPPRLAALLDRHGGPLELPSADDPRVLRPDNILRGLDPGFRAELGRFARELYRRMAALGRPPASSRGVLLAGEIHFTPQGGVPEHPLLAADRRLPVVLRHVGELAFDDEAILDCRCAHLRVLADAGDPTRGLLDLNLFSAPAYRVPHARAVMAWWLADRAGREAIADQTPGLRARMAAWIRDPDSYATLHYHALLTFALTDAGGGAHWARLRLIPGDRGPDRGFIDPARLVPGLEYVPRAAGDARPRAHLRDELRRRLAAGPVEYVLQIQTRPRGGDDDPALDTTVAWPEDQVPWRDLASLRLDRELADVDVDIRPEATPATLALPRAAAVDALASVGQFSAIANDIIARLHAGRPPHPELQAMIDELPAAAPAPAPTARRIGVIGAGAAGLVAARELQRRGLAVTVLERATSVGGKSACFDVDGRLYDLGTHLCTSQYHALRRLADEVGCPTELTDQLVSFDAETRKTYVVGDTFLGDIRSYARMLELRRDAFPGLGRPGLVHAAAALAEPAGAWLARHGLQALVHTMSLDIGYTSSGYGYLDQPDLPALYLMRMVELGGFLDTAQQRHYQGEWTIAGGFMNLWRRVAAQLHDVRLGVHIHAVDRLPDRVLVRTDAGDLEFDAIVVTTPLEASLGFLDADAEEIDLFGRVRYNSYYTHVVSLAGLPRKGFYMVAQHSLTGDRRGRVTAFHHRHADTDVYTVYAYGRPGQTVAEAQRVLREDVAALGGEVQAIHTCKRWDFFPHVGADDIRAGFYERIEARQGKRRTYYAGSALSFELVECVVAHAQELVARCFDEQAPPPAPRPVAPAADPSRPTRGYLEIRAWMVDHLAAELRVPSARIDAHVAMESYAIDSVVANSLMGEFSEWLGFRVTPALFVEHPTIDALARSLAGEDY